MTTTFHPRQIVSRATLAKLTRAANSALDSILSAIDKEVTPPLELKATLPTADRVVSIGSIFVQNPIGLSKKTIPTISNLLPNFTSGTVTFPSASGGSATPSAGSALVITVSSGNFIKVGINLDPTGNLILQTGTQGASELLATAPPAVPSSFAIGYVVLQNVAGTIQNITQDNIYQNWGGGGGSSGSGNASSQLETLKNMWVDSPFGYLAPNVISTDGSAKFGTLTGASYDIATGTIKFTANSQVAITTQILDAIFLGKQLDVGSIDLVTFWNKGSTLTSFSVPTAFTYEISRDGGTNWFTVTMTRIETTETFRGTFQWDLSTATTEATKQTIATQATQDANRVLNATTQQSVSQAFTLAATTKLQEVVLSMAKAGSPTGNFYVAIVKDNAGVPSTSAADVYCESNAVLISGVASGPANVTIDIPDTVLIAGTYHIVVRTDASYKSSFVSTTTELRLREKQVSPSSPFTKIFDGTTWSAPGTNGDLTFTLNGRALDLRVRLTSAGSPTYPCGLDAMGIYYGLQDVGIVGAQRKTQRFTFNTVTDNTASFAITTFNPDPDLLTCYGFQDGLPIGVWKVPAFQLNGSTAVFDAKTFGGNEISGTVTLIFDQNNGGAFDNSDSNARLMAANHLGSTGGDDRSASARGPLLRDGGGTLRELALNTLGYPVVLASNGGSVLRDTTTPATLDDATATRLGQKQYTNGVSYNGGNTITVTGTGYTLSKLFAIPYQMQDGTWRCRGTVDGSVTGSPTALVLTISGITFSSLIIQAGSVRTDASAYAIVRAPGGSGNLNIQTGAAMSTAQASFDFALDTKPTWAF